MSIIDRFLQLDLPVDQCVVIGSGILDALDLRQSRDIDIVARPDLFAVMETSGEWRVSVVRSETKLEKDDVEVWQSWGSEGVANFSDLYENSVIVRGVHFANPEFVLAWKRQQHRDKDVNDIQLLEEYLHHER